MPHKELDCTELACPQPVLKCREQIQDGNTESIRILVDNAPARDNVSRFLQSSNYILQEVKEESGVFAITAVTADGNAGARETASASRPEVDKTEQPTSFPGQVIFVTSDRIGHGDEELGAKLMRNFILTLAETGSGLWRIILINSGVKLAVGDSQVVDELRKLEAAGVSILVCGTCLEHFQLLQHKAVGDTTNMLDVVTSLQIADKVIKV